MQDTSKVYDFLYMHWLRPENAIFETAASRLIGEELLKSNRILEIGIGNGYFTFMSLDGKFKEEYDWYFNVNTEGFWENRDIYDFVGAFNIASYISAPAKKEISLAIDHKENLINQAMQLGFINKSLVTDANKKFVFNEIDTIFSNILYWLNNPSEVLKNIDQQLPVNGRIIMVFPNRFFYEYSRSYKEESKIWKLINRGRAKSMKWSMNLNEFEQRLIKNTGFEVEQSIRYLSKLTLETWDIGLRPLSPHLIKMANKLAPEMRLEVKMEWCETLKPFIENLLENELSKGEQEGGFNFVVLRKVK